METLRCVGRAELTLGGSFADMRLLPSTRNNHENKFLSSLDCPAVVPTLHPVLSAKNLISLVGSENASKFLLEVMRIRYVIEKIYIAGYVDGSVQIWDATSPVLSILCIIGTAVLANDRHEVVQCRFNLR
ncbi:hypothetical protein Tco_1296564 [Tanacetum coccineum]